MKRRVQRFFTHYFIPRMLAYGGKILLKALTLTCRVQVEGMEKFLIHAKKGNCILMLWHNRLMLVAPVFLRYASQFTYTAFISQSRDGEPLALFTNSFKNGRTIRVRHNAKHEALKMMIDRLKNSQEIILVTPDGPRGPRYQVKPGVAMAARETDAVVFPFSWSANHFWQLKSWDKMILPKPFSKIFVKIGEPIPLSKNCSIEEQAHLFKEALLLVDKESSATFSTKPA